MYNELVTYKPMKDINYIEKYHYIINYHWSRLNLSASSGFGGNIEGLTDVKYFSGTWSNDS